MPTPPIPKEVSQVTEVLEQAGFEAYLVGGCVRDLLLGREPKDWDITTNARPEEIQGLFAETYYNNDFGTVGVVQEHARDERVKVIEVTPYRSEGTYSDGRRPDRVMFGVSLEEDLKRRDFTINAIALKNSKGHVKDISKGHLIDPHQGIKDIEEKFIRAVGNPGERFTEDALRMMRAIRIAAELGFGIEQHTFEAIQEHAPLLKRISAERIRVEVERMLLSERPMEGLFHMKQTGLLQYIIPELEEGIGVEQNQAHSYTVFEHSLRALQHAADKKYSLEVRLAALFHDVGKPRSRRWSKENNDWTFYGHEVVGSRETKKIMQRMKFPAKTIEIVEKMVRWHMFFSDPDKITLSAVRRMIRNVGEEHIWSLLELRTCDRIGTGRPKEQPFRFRKYKSMVEEALRDPISVQMLNIDGESIMGVTREKPGPRIGWILHALLEEVIEDPLKNTENYLKKRAEELTTLTDESLKVLGDSGKMTQIEREAEEVKTLRKKYHVT